MLASMCCGRGRCRSKAGRARAIVSCGVSSLPSPRATRRRRGRHASTMCVARRRPRKRASPRCRAHRIARAARTESQQPATEEASMASSLTFQRTDVKTVNGYLAAPPVAAHAQGIVEIQEWWGLAAVINAFADLLARHGYRAAVPDLYRRKLPPAAIPEQNLRDGAGFDDAAA